MLESIHDYMQVGIVSFMAYPEIIKGEGPVLQAISEILEDPFFTAIEVTCIQDDSIRREAKTLLGKSGKTVGFGGQPPLLINKLSLSARNEKDRNKAISQSKACVDEACFLGAKGIGVLSSRFEGDEHKEEQTDQLVDSLSQLCDYAKTKGDLTVVLETFDRSIGKNCLIGPSAEAVAVAERIGAKYKNFGLMLDLSHLPLLGESSRQAIGLAKDYLVHTHIGNCVMGDKDHAAYGDEHPLLGIEEGENGVEELTEFLQALLEIGYLNKANPGIVSFEVKPFGNQTSEEVIETSKQVLRKAWQHV